MFFGPINRTINCSNTLHGPHWKFHARWINTTSLRHDYSVIKTYIARHDGRKKTKNIYNGLTGPICRATASNWPKPRPAICALKGAETAPTRISHYAPNLHFMQH
jgi:hypothetical protein